MRPSKGIPQLVHAAISHAYAMDPRRVLIFRTVVRAGSISAGARELGWTQPAVSQHLNALEREAGTSLLVRGAGGRVEGCLLRRASVRDIARINHYESEEYRAELHHVTGAGTAAQQGRPGARAQRGDRRVGPRVAHAGAQVLRTEGAVLDEAAEVDARAGHLQPVRLHQEGVGGDPACARARLLVVALGFAVHLGHRAGRARPGLSRRVVRRAAVAVQAIRRVETGQVHLLDRVPLGERDVGPEVPLSQRRPPG